MIHETLRVQVNGSQDYARLIIYIQEGSPALLIRKRKLILLCPGGGYEHTSDREAETMAIAFLSMGYHAAVLRYSVYPSRYPTALLEVAKSVQLLREHSEMWNIDENGVILQGCSAGGHLAASYCLFWEMPLLSQTLGIHNVEILRPNGMLLCYPVITGETSGSKYSFEHLLGDEYDAMKQSVALQNHVNAEVPPTFIWHTYTDPCVPVEDSIVFVQALKRQGISTEFHMFAQGGHGLALANKLTATASGDCIVPECASWIKMAETWLESL